MHLQQAAAFHELVQLPHRTAAGQIAAGSPQLLILCAGSGRIVEGDDAWHMIEPELVPVRPNSRRRCLSNLRCRRIFVSYAVLIPEATHVPAGQLVLCTLDAQAKI